MASRGINGSNKFLGWLWLVFDTLTPESTKYTWVTRRPLNLEPPVRQTTTSVFGFGLSCNFLLLLLPCYSYCFCCFGCNFDSSPALSSELEISVLSFQFWNLSTCRLGQDLRELRARLGAVNKLPNRGLRCALFQPNSPSLELGLVFPLGLFQLAGEAVVGSDRGSN